MFSKQETFDRVATHLLTQNERAVDGSRCLYRMRNLKCAAGYLIPDDEYSQEYERASVASLCNRHGWSSFFGHDIHLVSSLQAIHDCTSPHLWRESLTALAKREGLQINFK